MTLLVTSNLQKQQTEQPKQQEKRLQKSLTGGQVQLARESVLNTLKMMMMEMPTPKEQLLVKSMKT